MKMTKYYEMYQAVISFLSAEKEIGEKESQEWKEKKL